MDIVQLIQLALSVLTGLVGYPALLTVIATALEYFGWLSVEYSDDFLFWGNAVAFAGVVILGFLGKLDLVNQIDLVLGDVGKLITLALVILGVPMAYASAKTQHIYLASSRFLGLM